MTTIKNLAISRLRFNKSRTILTAIAIMLTTTLLMGVGTSAEGILDINRQQALFNGNTHAMFKSLTQEQVKKLQNHKDVESIEINELFATVEYGKMNGFLVFHNVVKEGIYHGVGNLIEGHEAQKMDEICGPKSFFERIGVEPVIGNKIHISFRPGGKGRIETREFTICGILSENDVSGFDVSDTRITYGASVSEALANAYIPDKERSYNTNIRVVGENRLNCDEIEKVINETAADVGCDKVNIILNREYLIMQTEMGTETKAVVAGISLIIILFSGLVIYSIYYVSVITDVQEIGKLKALGASDRQIKRLFLTEGFRISFFAVPFGLVFGYLIPYFALPVIFKEAMKVNTVAYEVDRLHMFSAPVLALVVVAVFVTVYLSLIRPMKMAAKVSPVEAIRYQESSSRRKMRKGNKNVNVFRLSAANLVQNRRRTLVTMLTMGFSCVLFMSLAGTMNSMSTLDMARRNIKKGDFRLTLDYACNDKEYPENNLDQLSMRNLFSDAFVESILQIDGVQGVEREGGVLIGSDFSNELFEDGSRISLSWFEREDVKEYEDGMKAGKIDYDSMVSGNGVILTTVFYEMYGMLPGTVIPVTVYDGDRQFTMDVRIDAVSPVGGDHMLLLPREVYERLNLQYDSTVDLYISIDQNKYEEVKDALTEIADAEAYFGLYSMDEEMAMGRMSVSLIKYPMYLVLALVAVIGFMNLVNTMITSVITRKRELGVLQAVGLSESQLTKMLVGEGAIFTAGTLAASVTVGNLFGYLVFLKAKSTGFMSISRYHYPVVETIGLTVALILGQIAITYFIRHRIRKESLIDTIRCSE